MKLLLDTNALLGLAGTPLRLSAKALHEITSTENEVWISAAAVWEAGIKYKAGKLAPAADLPASIGRSGFPIREITAEDGWRAGNLPLIHKDPFDRVMVAQALIDGATLVTRDGLLAQYGVQVLAA